METNWDAKSWLVRVKPWIKHLFVVGLLAVVLAVVFSSSAFITPLYKSQSRVYPTNTKAFSEESESEQMLEVINSTDIKRKMVETFNLTERYRIKADARFPMTQVLKKYDEYVSCSKTRFETIEISVLDADPQVATDMVDSLIVFYNGKMLEMCRERYQKELESYQANLQRKQVEIDSLNRKMEVYRRNYGLLDYESQTLQLTLGYAEGLARGASRASIDDLQKRLNQLADKGGEFWQMQNEMEELFSQREEISKNVEEKYSLVSRKDNFALIVEQAFPADKKSYPVRWVIVVAALVSTEFLALLLVLLLGPRRTKS